LEKAGAYLQIAIAGFTDSVATVSARQFEPGHRVNAIEYPGPARFNSTSRAELSMGEHKAFDDYEKKYPRWYFSDQVDSTIRFLLNEQIRIEPGSVGPPISVLSITSAGHDWVQAGACSGNSQRPKR
jgi:hypothetical protein